MTEDEIVQLYKQFGWNDENAIRGDIRAGNWQSKVASWLGSSGAGGKSPLPEYNFNYDKAVETEMNAASELSVYYQKLLDIYGGDVALAKQRIDQDYERGLRVKSTEADWTTAGIQQQKAERQRQFKIAMRDLDESMNRRGLTTSGIAEQARQEAVAGEQYQMGQLGRQEQQVARELAQYKEGADTEYRREMEKYGFMKPETTQVAGQYAPSQTGIQEMPKYVSMAGYRPETAVKELSIEEEKRKAAMEKANAAMQRAYTQWSIEAQRLAANYQAPETKLTA